MQRPLDPARLLALVEDGNDAGSSYIGFTKRHFREQNMCDGMDNLILSFDMFVPYLHILCRTWKNYGPHKWRIDFGNRPFTHLSIRPDPDHRAFIKVYEDDKQIQTYEMLGHPEQWQAFMKWLWNYGNDRLLRQAAIEARRRASRHHSKPQISYNYSRSKVSRKHPTQKEPQDIALHRLLHSKAFKARVSKSREHIKPSRLGMASLTMADMEGEAGEDQALQEKDHNGRINMASRTETATNGDFELKTISGDIPMAGAAE